MTAHEKELKRLHRGANGLLAALSCEKVVDMFRFSRIRTQRDEIEKKIKALEKEKPNASA